MFSLFFSNFQFLLFNRQIFQLFYCENVSEVHSKPPWSTVTNWVFIKFSFSFFLNLVVLSCFLVRFDLCRRQSIQLALRTYEWRPVCQFHRCHQAKWPFSGMELSISISWRFHFRLPPTSRSIHHERPPPRRTTIWISHLRNAQNQISKHFKTTFKQNLCVAVYLCSTLRLATFIGSMPKQATRNMPPLSDRWHSTDQNWPRALKIGSVSAVETLELFWPIRFLLKKQLLVFVYFLVFPTSSNFFFFCLNRDFPIWKCPTKQWLGFTLPVFSTEIYL